MNEWFHARDGRQTGPVGWDELRQMARHGALSPADLVWNNSMADWQPAGKVEGLFDARHSAADSSAPMPSAQAPVDALPPLPSSPSPHRLPDIAPGSDPIRPVDC